MAMQRVKRHLPALKALSKATKKVQKAMISKASKDFIETLVEICMNIIKGNVPLNKAQFDSLKRFRQQLRKVTLKNTSQVKKRQLLMRGGFLGALLKPLLGLLLR